MKLNSVIVSAGFRTIDYTSDVQRAYGEKVRVSLCDEAERAESFAEAEASFERARTSVDGGLREIWLQVEGSDETGKYVSRIFTAEL